MARAKPAILAASAHLLATSLMSDCREQVILAPASTPNARATCDDGRAEEARPPILAGISVAAAWRDAAMMVGGLVRGRIDPTRG